ncbi:C40 family peptidase [candidate division KSB1 bacterium]|nr:C40 family peptidase [candidate division KSB1 bacterium]
MLYKRYLICLLFLFYAYFPWQVVSGDTIQDVAATIDSVKLKFGPDHRISVFNINYTFQNDTLILTGDVIDPAAQSTLINQLSTIPKITIIDSITVLPDSSVIGTPKGIICISVAQLRRGPDVDQEMISQAIMGMEIKILKKSGYFLYCQMEDGYLGWMMKSSVAGGDDAFIKKWRAKPKLIVTALYGTVRQTHSDDAMPVSDLVRGAILAKVDSRRGWYQVELPDGRLGYVRKNLVMDTEKWKQQFPPTADAIVKTAETVYGVPYLWGGISIKGFDCSGFTQSTFKFNGIQLPRDANMQVNEGDAVPLDENLSNLKPGDLLFFGRTPERITHVALYISNGQFIHSDGYVHINSFNPVHENYSEYRLMGLQAARRIIKP